MGTLIDLTTTPPRDSDGQPLPTIRVKLTTPATQHDAEQTVSNTLTKEARKQWGATL